MSRKLPGGPDRLSLQPLGLVVWNEAIFFEVMCLPRVFTPRTATSLTSNDCRWMR
jgi:hypothetical protein